MSIAHSVVTSVVSEARFHGVSPATLLAHAEVAPGVVDDPAGRVELVDVRRIVRAALELTGRPELGLWVGGRAPIGSMRGLAPALECSRSLRVAVGFFERYGALIADGIRVELVDCGPATALRFHPHVTSDATSERFWSEYVFALVARLLRALLGAAATPLEVRFRHARAAPLPIYREFTFGEPAFEAAWNELVVATEIVDRPSVYADDAIVRFAEARAESQLASLAEATRLSSRVVEVLAISEELASLDATSVAARLGVSERTLRRRLQAEDTTWSTLFDAERSLRARAALLGSTVPVKELSDRLGFSETSAFVRAFKRWSGSTPAAFRRAGDGRVGRA